ncbi:MAG: YdcF family protein, partial [Eggerthellaceae bacterium]|nr:YdcF family protein [Eggerthellaceae bacterium]
MPALFRAGYGVAGGKVKGVNPTCSEASLALVLGILGVLCIAYGVSIMMIWSGTWFFGVWYALGVVLLVFAWVLHVGVWDAAPLVIRRIVQGFVCACAVVLLVTQACSLSGFNQHGEDDLDYIIVLGAQVRETGPSAVLLYRLDTAYEYLCENPETICIVSGGQGPNEPLPEAHVMAAYLQDWGISEERIIVEDESLNTNQNILNSMEAFEETTAHVGVVTNDFHVFRGVHIARKQGIDHACGIAAPSKIWYLPNNLLRESFGIT